MILSILARDSGFQNLDFPPRRKTFFPISSNGTFLHLILKISFTISASFWSISTSAVFRLFLYPKGAFWTIPHFFTFWSIPRSTFFFKSIMYWLDIQKWTLIRRIFCPLLIPSVECISFMIHCWENHLISHSSIAFRESRLSCQHTITSALFSEKRVIILLNPSRHGFFAVFDSIIFSTISKLWSLQYSIAQFSCASRLCTCLSELSVDFLQ